MDKRYKKLIEVLGENKVQLNEPLDKYSSFHIGGPADIFYRAKTCSDLIKAFTNAKRFKIPVIVISGGTNLLISDNGYRGLLIKNETNNIKLAGFIGGKKEKTTEIHTVLLEVESGVSINRLVRFTLDQGLAGLEAFLGQPGSVGGAVWNNAHNMKMGKFFGDKITSAKILQPSGKVVEVTKNYFKFGYDQSIIQKTGDIVLTVRIKLNTGKKDILWKKAQEAFEYRQKTQPTGVFSSGCIFKNIKKSTAVRLATPNYTCSAGFLLDRAGLKGFQIGNAYFSKNHANFIINNGKAKAQDVFNLIKLAKKRIKKDYQVDLEEEIVFIGEF